jgi:RecJ-like exonuclease
VEKKELEVWEIICDKCHGFGKKPGTNLVCRKCGGEGKLDWIENVVGKRKKNSWFSFLDEFKTEDFWPDTELLKEIGEDLSEQMAKQVDREIMKQILGRERS